MKYEYITNSGPHSIGSLLNSDFERCKSFNIASAFISESRIDHLESLIKRNKHFNEGKLLISLYDFFNTKAALQKLKDLRSKYSGRIYIRISKNPKFHWKYYNFTIGRTYTHYVGSANYTNGGLSKNGELLIKFKEPLSKDSSLLKAFDEEWGNSFSIDKLQLSDYPEIQRDENTPIPKSIKLLLKDKPVKQTKAMVRNNLVLIYISGELSPRTVKALIHEDSNWDKYDFFSCIHKSEFLKFQLNTSILIISKEKGKYCYHHAKVKGLSDNVSTPDGKYFVAYIPPSKTRQISNTAEEALLSCGIKLTGRKWKSRFKVFGSYQSKKISSAFR